MKLYEQFIQEMGKQGITLTSPQMAMAEAILSERAVLFFRPRASGWTFLIKHIERFLKEVNRKPIRKPERGWEVI